MQHMIVISALIAVMFAILFGVNYWIGHGS